MASEPKVIRGINDVGATLTVNVLAGETGRTLSEPSMISIFANQEAVTGSWQCNIGVAQILPQNSPATLQATVGVMPSIRDDLLVLSTGDVQDEIFLNYTNGDAAVAREGRFIVNIIPVGAQRLLQFMQSVGVSVPGAQAVMGS